MTNDDRSQEGREPSSRDEFAIETRGLTRRFGDFVAVDDIDLRVPKGSFFGFLGPNGAGKSTTIRCLTGLLAPTEGSIEILGLDSSEDPIGIRRRIGVLPEELALFDRLTARENLSFVARVHEVDEEVFEHRMKELLELFDLADTGGTIAADFSHGMRKKLALAMAILPSPRLLFLDEPFEGIDAVSSRQMKQFLRSYTARGGTVFLTSHVLEIVDRLADQVAIIVRGRLVAQGPTQELRTASGSEATLEEVFLETVGVDELDPRVLDWLGT